MGTAPTADLTIPLFKGSAPSPTRTGRRRKIRKADGTRSFFRIKAVPVKYRPNRYRIQNSQNSNLGKSRTPPARGVPGAILALEGCTPTGKEDNALAGGTSARALRRRAYRAWRRQRKTSLLQGADSLVTPPTQSKEATPKRSKWFRQALYWQESLPRKTKRGKEVPRTTPPLPYKSKMRIGALNVQGMADALKLKSLLQLMDAHRLGVLMLNETRSTSYYSYLSEQHLVILSGNTKDKYAGVGAIVHPQLRQHLADVVQVSSSILHLVFNKQGGKVHVVGVYAPHSGHDLEQVRQPFWDSLDEYLTTIPQPEPVYLTGDFNVRFQAQRPRDLGVTGPYTYGKGKRYIDHTADSNRSLCIKTMQLQNMVEVASYKTPLPVQHTTYRDKAAPPGRLGTIRSGSPSSATFLPAAGNEGT